MEKMDYEILEFEGFTFKIFNLSDKDSQKLNESKDKGKNLVGTYTYDIHPPHNPTGEYHIHLRNKGNEILSMNKVSGTAHDGYHGVRIPNKAFKALKDKYPDWKWPENQIIESKGYTYILDKNQKCYLRQVKVFAHQDYNQKMIETYVGFFHEFANDPFLTGGNVGWINRTIAIIESLDGSIAKVPIGKFKFINVSE